MIIKWLNDGIKVHIRDECHGMYLCQQAPKNLSEIPKEIVANIKTDRDMPLRIRWVKNQSDVEISW